MGVKFAVAMGCEVVMITTSAEKGADAKRLGAHDVLVSTDRDAMKAHRGSFDFLLNTVPVKHDLNPYLMLLARNGTMVIVGAIEPLEPMHGGLLLSGRKRVAGSGIGGIAETQEMLDFCAKHGVTSDIEVIAMKDINAAYDRVVKGDVKYRFVIDMATL
jgi:alcohol dehydrogenase (NADP+)